jgi:hemerythrin-like domain-containing protein
MTHAALRIIRAEHSALRSMLEGMRRLMAGHRPGSSLPDFTALRAVVFYIDEFPEKCHHRKESELLFPKLRARTPLSRSLLDHLDGDHLAGERNVRELARTLLAYEFMGEPRRHAFERTASRYIDFYLAHMEREEREVLPLAERVLTESDWDELDQAFKGHEDPLTVSTPSVDYEQMLECLASIARTPV